MFACVLHANMIFLTHAFLSGLALERSLIFWQIISLSSGQNVEKDVSSQSHLGKRLSQSLSGLKEEVTGQDGGSVKHEVRTFLVSLF